MLGLQEITYDQIVKGVNRLPEHTGWLLWSRGEMSGVCSRRAPQTPRRTPGWESERAHFLKYACRGGWGLDTWVNNCNEWKSETQNYSGTRECKITKFGNKNRLRFVPCTLHTEWSHDWLSSTCMYLARMTSSTFPSFTTCFTLRPQSPVKARLDLVGRLLREMM